ncbi:MAG: hypothetical protein ACOYU0_05910 [Nitrospirota bacterium]
MYFSLSVLIEKSPGAFHASLRNIHDAKSSSLELPISLIGVVFFMSLILRPFLSAIISWVPLKGSAP